MSLRQTVKLDYLFSLLEPEETREFFKYQLGDTYGESSRKDSGVSLRCVDLARL